MSNSGPGGLGLEEILDAPPDQYRIVALYTIDQHWDLATSAGQGQPVSSLFCGSRFQRFYERRSTMFPASFGSQEVNGADLGLPAVVQDCSATWVRFQFPSGQQLGALGLSFALTGQSLEEQTSALVEVRQRIDGDRDSLPLGGDETALGPDFHQVLLIPQIHALHFGADPLADDVQRLVGTRTDTARPAFESARLPRNATVISAQSPQ